MDIRTSDWGPYSSQLPGISHLCNGSKFTLAVLPGTMSSHHPVVDFREANGSFEILSALPDLTYYHHRYRIGPERDLLSDIEYFTLSPESAAVSIKYTNSGKRPANVETFLAFQAECDQDAPIVSCSPNSVLLDSNDYCEIDPLHTGWVTDLKMGIFADSSASNGNAIYWGTVYKGEFVRWRLPHSLTGRYILSIRYCLNGPDRPITIEGTCKNNVLLENTLGKYVFSEPVYCDCHGDRDMLLKYEPCQYPLQIDCIVLTPVEDELPTASYTTNHSILDEIEVNPATSISTMKAAPTGKYYGIWSSNARRETSPVGPRRNHYAVTPGTSLSEAARLCNMGNLLSGNLPIAGVMCIGNQNIILAPGESLEELIILSTADSQDTAAAKTQEERLHLKHRIDTIRTEYESHAKCFKGPEQVVGFAERLAAQTLTNINYPGILGADRQQKVRYYTPAKFYGTFYLWDMGMTGVGLSSVASQQTEDLFRQYLPSDDRVPFIAWGTMLPCHIFLYWNHFQTNRDLDFLANNFELAMRMYKFFAGHDPRSKMRDPHTGLLTNFKYSYNSGGWDDYPAQQRYHQIGSDRIFPVVCTAQTVIAAKMLRLAALELDKKQEFDILDKDITEFENLLYEYHWNENEGIFSYYDARDTEGRFLEIEGEDANKGLDGLFPLASGSLKPDHVDRIVQTVTDEKRYLTQFGLTTVDMSAGYYRPDGYWNGHVWVPPTWFFFRGLLNYGYISQARDLAERVIGSFMKASKRQGTIVECIDNELGHPEHVPYFSGLTAPLLDLIDSLYGSRQITTGPDIDAKLVRYNDSYSLNAISPSHRGRTGLILTLDNDRQYSMRIAESDRSIELTTDRFGKTALCLNIDRPLTHATIHEIDKQVCV